MSSFSESNFTNDHSDSNGDNGSVHRERQGHNYRQQRNGKRHLRKNFERQLSDKHLKRRAQIIQMQSNNTNRRFLYQHQNDYQHTFSTSSSFPPLNEQYQQSQFDCYRRPNRGGFSLVHNKRIAFFTIMSLIVILSFLILGTLPTGWNLFFSSSGTTILSPREIQRTTTTMYGENNNNNKAYGNDNRDSNGGENDHVDENNRSYQDLADSIKRLRIRRQVLREETDLEWGEQKEERQFINDDKIDYNNGDYDDQAMKEYNEGTINHNKPNEAVENDEGDDIRLKRLEQKIQMDQNKKVREEFSLSNENINSGETDSHKKGNNWPKKNEAEDSAKLQHKEQRRNKDQQHGSESLTDTTSLKDKLMTENIAALRVFNDKNKSK